MNMAGFESGGFERGPEHQPMHTLVFANESRLVERDDWT
jgi:hypothetical protein